MEGEGEVNDAVQAFDGRVEDGEMSEGVCVIGAGVVVVVSREEGLGAMPVVRVAVSVGWWVWLCYGGCYVGWYL